MCGVTQNKMPVKTLNVTFHKFNCKKSKFKNIRINEEHTVVEIGLKTCFKKGRYDFLTEDASGLVSV